MTTTGRPARELRPSADTVAFVAEAYERGQTLEALRRAEAHAPLCDWHGAQACVLAARIAANSGAPNLALRLSVRAWRADRRDPEVLAQYSYETLTRRGPLAVWNLLRGITSESNEQHAEILALQARVALELRDFGTGEQLIARAESLAPKRAWIHLQRAWLLEHLDRIEEALEVAQAASVLHPYPFHRPATQTCAHLLQLLDRDDDAIELLQRAMGVLQNAPVAAQLYSLLSENGRWAEAEEALQRFEILAALLEPATAKWLRSQQARVAYHLGKRADAVRFAEKLDDPFHKNFVEKLRDVPRTPEQLQLDIRFVRQHFKTCAPATLAAIGRYWRMPADHLRLAEEMCYDGTPAWQQRDWAQRNGWYVREFRVTAESAHALLLREVPFAITTVEATSAHMMAVIGFDQTRGALLLRDPAQPYVIEWPIDEFFSRYRAFGPRGMVFVPLAEQARLEGVELPDCELHDHYHEFSLALAAHDRETATAELARMEARAADDALTWSARLDLAAYDDNLIEQIRCLDRLLEIFPGNAARLLRRLDCMYQTSREDRLQFLEAACKAKDADPALHIALARALCGDARRAQEAQRWLQRALRKRHTDSSAIKVRADLLWEAGEFDEATECYRFAAFIDGFGEHLYRSWFLACRQTRRTEETLQHLQDRYERFGARSEQPALTLAWAWNEVGQPQRAREVLQSAIRLRPADGQLLLRAASLVGVLGEAEEAAKLLEAAKGKVRENDWLRTRMELAEQNLDFESMLSIARELLQREPVALDAHAAIARALSRREGISAARAALQAACAAHPHHCGLRRMLVEWSRESGPSFVVDAAREVLRLEPSDAWAHRELALALLRLNKVDEALHAANEALRIEPANSYSASTLGFVYRRSGRVADARAEFRKAIVASVDNNYAIESLLELARSDQERKEDVAFIEQELLRQVVSGDGLLTYLEIARPILEPEQLLAIVHRAHEERPDLWHAWGALVSQLVHMARMDDALSIAIQATERFPHLPRTWLDLATVRQRRRELPEEIAALERAFEINPSWPAAAIALARAYERDNRFHEALATYERALRHSAHDPVLRAAYASMLWRRQKSEEALAAIEHALRLAPAYQFAWDQLCDWSTQCGDSDRAGRFARTLVQEHGGEPRIWLMLARILPPSSMPERLAAVERASELDGQSTETWDLKAELLTIAERFDDAIRACEQGMVACTVDVHILEGRRAWIEAQRAQIDEAIRRMQSVLAENRNYAWGWFELVVWLLQTDKLAEAKGALETMRQLWPHDAWVHRQLASLLRKEGDAAAARAAYGKALELVPTEVSAAHNLLQMQMEASDLEGAVGTLAIMQVHQPGTATLAAEIDVRLAQGDLAAACKALEGLCISPDPDPWPLDSAAESFERAGRVGKALRVLRRVLRAGGANPELGVAMVRLLTAKRAFTRAVVLFLKLPPGELRRRAAAPLMQVLVENRRRLLFQFVLWLRRDVLHEDDATWGQVGYGLITFNRMRRVADWLSDWKKRDNVQPWMLFNYCLALRHVGRYAEATEVARHVTRTWGHREGAADMHLFVAIEEALDGSIAAAEDHLKLATIREDVTYDQQLSELARALIDFRRAEPQERRELFRQLRNRLDSQFSGMRFAHSMRDVRRTFRRAGDVFKREGAGPAAWLWSRWKLNWQWSFVPLIGAYMIVATSFQPWRGSGLLTLLVVAYLIFRPR